MALTRCPMATKKHEAITAHRGILSRQTKPNRSLQRCTKGRFNMQRSSALRAFITGVGGFILTACLATAAHAQTSDPKRDACSAANAKEYTGVMAMLVALTSSEGSTAHEQQTFGEISLGLRSHTEFTRNPQATLRDCEVVTGKLKDARTKATQLTESRNTKADDPRVWACRDANHNIRVAVQDMMRLGRERGRITPAEEAQYVADEKAFSDRTVYLYKIGINLTSCNELNRMINALAAKVGGFTYEPPPPVQPALSSPDLQKVMQWIAQEVSNGRQAFCYKQSYGRGVGVPLSTCSPDQQLNGLLCYPKCKDGYGGAGPACWQNCPSGFRDDGAFCAKPAAYGRGAGYPWKFGDSLNDNGMRGRCEDAHGRGNCEKDGAIFYPKCKPGFNKVGCCICSPNCQGGMVDIGVSCTKQTYTRGAGYPMKCAAGQQEDAGLCYTPCNANYSGVGPVCWQGCPSGRHNCGAGCSTSAATCFSATSSMVIAPIVLAVNIATAGSTSSMSKTTYPMLADAMKKIKDIKAVADQVKIAGTAAYQAAQTTQMWVMDYVGNFEAMTNAKVVREINSRFTGNANLWVKQQYAMSHLSLMLQSDGIQTAQNTINVIATFDPTGVAGVIDAFAKPICATDQGFPSVTIR